MALKTPIQWADSTTNPVMGCEGCELFVPGIGGPCYTGNEHDILGRSQNSTGYAPDFFTPTLFRAREHPNRLTTWKLAKGRGRDIDLRGRERDEKPWLNGLPRIIFVSDMGDALSRGRYVEATDVEVLEWKPAKNGRLRPAKRAARPEAIVIPEDPEAAVALHAQRHPSLHASWHEAPSASGSEQGALPAPHPRRRPLACGRWA